MREDIDAFIEPIVAAARTPSCRRRDELRRELRSHFEDSGLTPEALHDAVARFDKCNPPHAVGFNHHDRSVSDRAFVSAFRTT